MTRDARRRERRGPDRPRDGDTQPCPFCRAGPLVFAERVPLGAATVPAWVCENAACEYRVLARRKSLKQRLDQSQRLYNDSQRAMMRAKSRIARAKRRLTESSQRVRKRKMKKS
jgi:hypothetical protein